MKTLLLGFALIASNSVLANAGSVEKLLIDLSGNQSTKYELVRGDSECFKNVDFIYNDGRFAKSPSYSLEGRSETFRSYFHVGTDLIKAGRIEKEDRPVVLSFEKVTRVNEIKGDLDSMKIRSRKYSKRSFSLLKSKKHDIQIEIERTASGFRLTYEEKVGKKSHTCLYQAL